MGTTPERHIVFMGSPDFAVPSLDALAASRRYCPALVVSQPDRPRGRGRRTAPTAVRRRALDLDLPTLEMSRANYATVVAELAALAPEIVVVVAFGIIVRRDLLDLPARGCINVHASLLPMYRGVSPVQAALLAGDTVTGCTTMRMDEGIDTGDVYLRREMLIDPDDTAGSLTDRLSRLGADLLLETLDAMFAGEITPEPQGESPTPYARRVRKSDGEIDWTLDAPVLERRVRAMTPWPSAFTHCRGGRVIVTRARVAPDLEGSSEPGGRHAGTSDSGRTGTREINAAGPEGIAAWRPGRVVSTSPLRIACGRGALDIERLKPEGAREMTAAEYLAGHLVSAGDDFSFAG